MIRLLLSKFLKILPNPLYNYNSELLSKLISNDSLINELIIKKRFQTLWRESLGYNITKETYKIIKLKTKKEKEFIKASVTIIHKFSLTNCPKSFVSKELINYIFIIKKDKSKKFIHELYTEETLPALYNESSPLDNNFSSLNNKSRIDYWREKIDLIDEISLLFTKPSRIYRSNYIDTKYSSPYNPLKSIAYAQRHALNYNKDFKSFDKEGGDCTNFISQCINHGGISVSNTWKPYTHPWLRVNELYYYLLRRGLGQDITNIKPYPIGSIIQFYSNKKGFFSHSGIITKELANGDYLYCCHSYDKINFPLSEIFPLMYDKIRVVEIY
ncbi:amidase domain-containing protein [Clostridium sp. LP20]|uniref:amidase domain-containing protein n=1 Tax=Clostridium sp. LP20 TaxID=3418665 RepID=UPI003EE5EE63